MHDCVSHFKSRWLESVLDEALLEQACRQAGLIWRERLLTPIFTLRLFLLQILHGNVACKALPHLAQRQFTDTAYCQARQRIPLSVFGWLLEAFTDAATQVAALVDTDRWHGHRVWLLDGTGCSTPDTPALQAHFGQPKMQKTGCGFPVVYGLALVHYGSGLIQQWLAAPQPTSEARMLARLHTQLQPNDVAVADENFGYYGHIALLWQRGVHVLFRLSSQRIVDFTPGRPHTEPESLHRHRTPGLPRSRWLWQWRGEDQVVQWHKPWQCPAWMPKEVWATMPRSMMLRELRYQLTCPGFRSKQVTLVTTLLNAEVYPAAALAQLYGKRWTIETNFRHLKITLGMDQLHCRTVAGVLKEMSMFCLVYNLVRLAMGLAARDQGVPLEQISFKDAWRWLQCGSNLETLSWIATLHLRPHRLEPRVLKRRQKKYPLLQQPRAQLRKPLTSQTLGP
jgi:hypothetical protein